MSKNLQALTAKLDRIDSTKGNDRTAKQGDQQASTPSSSYDYKSYEKGLNNRIQDNYTCSSAERVDTIDNSIPYNLKSRIAGQDYTSVDFRNDQDTKRELIQFSEAFKKELRQTIDEFKLEMGEQLKNKDDCFKIQLQLEDTKRQFLLFQQDYDTKNHNCEFQIKQHSKFSEDLKGAVIDILGRLKLVESQLNTNQAANANNGNSDSGIIKSIKDLDDKLVGISSKLKEDMTNMSKIIKEMQDRNDGVDLGIVEKQCEIIFGKYNKKIQSMMNLVDTNSSTTEKIVTRDDQTLKRLAAIEEQLLIQKKMLQGLLSSGSGNKHQQSDKTSSYIDDKIRQRVADNTAQIEALLLALKSVEKKLISIKKDDITGLVEYCRKMKENLKQFGEENELKNQIMIQIGTQVSDLKSQNEENLQKRKNEADLKFESQLVTIRENVDKLTENQVEIKKRLCNSEENNEKLSKIDLRLSSQADNLSKLFSQIKELQDNQNQSKLDTDSITVNIENHGSEIGRILLLSEEYHSQLNNLKEQADLVKAEIDKIVNSGVSTIHYTKAETNLLIDTLRNENLDRISQAISSTVQEPKYIPSNDETLTAEISNLKSAYLLQKDGLQGLKDDLENTKATILSSSEVSKQLSSNLTDLSQEIGKNNDLSIARQKKSDLFIEEISKSLNKRKGEIENIIKSSEKAAEVVQTIITEQIDLKSTLGQTKIAMIENHEKLTDTLQTYINKIDTQHQAMDKRVSLNIIDLQEIIKESSDKSQDQITSILHRLNEVVEHFEVKIDKITKEVEILQQLYSKNNMLLSRNPIDYSKYPQENLSSNLKIGTEELLVINTKSINLQENNADASEIDRGSQDLEVTQAEGNVRCFQSGFVSSLNPMFLIREVKSSNIKQSVVINDHLNYREIPETGNYFESEEVVVSSKSDIKMNIVKSNIPTRSVYRSKEGEELGTQRPMISEKFKKNQLYLTTTPLNFISVRDELPEYLSKPFMFEKSYENVLEIEIDMNEEDHLSVISLDNNNKYESKSKSHSNDDLINLDDEYPVKEGYIVHNQTPIKSHSNSFHEDSVVLQSIEEINEYQSGETPCKPYKNLSQMTNSNDDIVNDEIQIINSEDEFY